MKSEDPSEKHSPVENELLRYFRDSKELTIFDIGSCDGQDAILYSQLLPQSKVYSFEPVPENVRRIKENIASAQAANIRVYELALSNSTGTAKLQVSSGTPDPAKSHISQSSSLLAPDKHLEIYPWCKFEDQLDVKTETIQNFCAQTNIITVDFIHLDVQGAELMVLEGAGEVINRIHGIWLEVENVSLYKNQPLRKDVESFMRLRDFVLVKFRVGGFSGDQFYLSSSFIKETRGAAAVYYLSIRSWVLRNFLTIMVSRIFRKLKFLLK